MLVWIQVEANKQILVSIDDAVAIADGSVAVSDVEAFDVLVAG